MEDLEKIWFTFLSLQTEAVIQSQQIDGKCATDRKHFGTAD